MGHAVNRVTLGRRLVRLQRMPHPRPAVDSLSQRTVRAAIFLVCLVAVSGCRMLPFAERPAEARPDPPEPTVPAEPEAEPEAAGEPLDLSGAIAALQDGRVDQAERAFARIVERSPANATARLMLAQIRQPPQALLGEDFIEVTVRAGDSLSRIAGRELGNELLFYSLARLNDIEVPRLIRAGRRLRVPGGTEEALPAPPPSETVSADNDPGVAATARALLESGRPAQAHALLISAARGGNLTAAGRGVLVDAAIILIDDACEHDEPERGRRILDQTLPWAGELAESERIQHRRRHIAARLELGSAQAALQAGREDEALQALMRARERDAGLESAHDAMLEAVKSELTRHYHARALTAWRGQRVDEAIQLWERVIRIDPAFRPAAIYLERARDAQHRMNQLDEASPGPG